MGNHCTCKEDSNIETEQASETNQNLSFSLPKTSPKPLEPLKAPQNYYEITEDNGAIYKGQMLNNKKHGKGFLLDIDGDTYEGEFKEDKINGFGIFKSKDGTIYKGNWINNQQDGNGFEKWEDGCTYEGNYKNGLKHGMGIYYFSDGSFYNGDWVAGKMEGMGEYRYVGGIKFVGEFKNGEKHGKGRIFKEDYVFEGFFLNNKKEGEAVKKFTDGRVVKEVWKENVLVDSKEFN